MVLDCLGKHLVRILIEKGHNVTIATRGRMSDNLEGKVKRLIIERTNPDNLAINRLKLKYIYKHIN